MNSITIGLNLPNEVKERTVWKNYQNSQSLSVLQSAPPTCYYHKVQTQAVFSKMNVRRRKEKEEKKAALQVSSVSRLLHFFLMV